MRLRRLVLAALLASSPSGVACRRRTESTKPPEPTASAVTSESASAKRLDARIGDLVEVAAGAPVASAPGGSATAKVVSSPALVIGLGGDGHRRLLLADGVSGWTPAPLRVVSSTRVRPSTSLELDRFPPGDARRKDPDEKSTVVLPAHAVANVAGASFERDAPSDRALRLDQAPFLEQPNLLLQLGPTSTGFVHGLTFDLEWTAPPSVDLAQLGSVRGIVRRPFLGPFAAAALAIAPRAGDTTHVVVDTTKDFDVFRALPAPAHKWTSLETLVVDPTANAPAIASLAVVGDGGAFALVFVGKGKSESVVLPRADIGSPWVTRAEMADLDGDGLAEWLVELVDRTSHGLTTRLLIVSGTSLQSGLSGAVLRLGGEPGEGDPTERYAWYVDGRQLFVARDRDTRAACQSVSMAKSGPMLDSTPRLVSIKTFIDAAPARSDASNATDGRQALPIDVSGKPRWTTGRCFRRAAEAAAWAAQVGGRVL